jgi:hypothetical protein
MYAMAHKGWMESIADKDSREAAREKFHEWCEMKESVHDEIEFVNRQNDVARLHIQDRSDTYHARNLLTHYNGCPVRAIDIMPVDERTLEVQMLLAELVVSDVPESSRQSA